MSPSLLNADVSPLDEAGLRQALTEGVGIEAISLRRGAVQETHQRHTLLSPRAEWPRRRRAAKRRNELSSLHVRPFAQHERILAAKLGIREGRIRARKPSLLRRGEACLALVQQAAEDGGP